MKMRLPLFIIIVVAMFVAALVVPVHAFNLIQDIDKNTQWTLGSSVNAGTSIVLRHDDSVNARAGQFVGSALASVANYRMLNLSAGGTFIPQPGGDLKALDTAKVGLNLAYVFQNFANQPPAIIKNLVVGPALATSIVTTPHVVIPTFDINYAFGGTATPQQPLIAK